MRDRTTSSVRRYLGLELLGVKNARSSLAVLDYFPKEQKVFLVELLQQNDLIQPSRTQSADALLLAALHEYGGAHRNTRAIGVNAALSLPSCVECKRVRCPMPEKCTVAEVKWMRAWIEKHEMGERELLPYTQRPVEYWLRTQVLKKMQKNNKSELLDPIRIEIDEALGGSRAPLTARMHFLKRHAKKLPLIEVLPRVTVALMAHELGLSRRTVLSYRSIEDGADSRAEVIDAFCKRVGIFIYDRDARKMIQHLPTFDAFIAAVTAIWKDLNLCAKPPVDYPKRGGWVYYPE